MTKNNNTIVEKSGLSLNLDQSGGKMTLFPLNFSSPKDIFSFSTSSVAIEEAQKSDPAFSLKPLLLDNSQVDLAQGLSSGETTLDQIFSWHNTQVINETNAAAAPLVQNNIQNALIAFGNNAYESLIPIKPFQSNDFGSFQSDFQPGKIAANALDVNNFQPPASNQVGIFYEAATDAEFAQAAGLKTELELPSEFDYVDITSSALPALTPAIHDGRLIERLIEEEPPIEVTPVLPRPQANPDFNTYIEGSGTPVTGNVITNDDTNNGGPLTVIIPGTYQGTFGELALNQNGTYTYTPYDPATNPATLQALNIPGVHQDVFNYTVENPNGNPTSSTVTIKIVTDPQANPDTNSYTEGSGTPVTGNVITNDDSNSGGNLTVITPGTYQGTFGELTLNQNGTYTYSPYDPATHPDTLQALNTPGVHQDVFDYSGENASGEKISSTLTIKILTDPQANPDTNSYTEGSGTPVTGNVITNDDSNSGGNLTVITPGTYQGTFGELTLNQDGTYTYSPYDPATHPDTLQALNTPGVHQDVFDYSGENASGEKISSTLTIKILTDPQANPDTNSYTEGSGTPVTGNVITNDDTNNGGNLTVITPGTYQGTFGELTLNQDGTYTYTPYDPSTNPATLQALNTPGVHQDVFNYTGENADGEERSSTLTIKILTDPQANPDTNSYTEGLGTPVTGNVITNDDTNSGGNLTVITPGTYQGTFGELTLNQDGTYTYSPYDPSTHPTILQALNTPGADQDVFNYTDTNASGEKPSSTLTINIFTEPPVPEPNSYKFDTDVVTRYESDPNGNDYYENGYYRYDLNNINIINDPASDTGQVDYDPQNENISVYKVTDATLTIAGQNVALIPSTLFSNDTNVVGEYDFTYEGTSGTIVEYKNGDIKIFSQDDSIFPYVDVGQQVVFGGNYSIINQDGIISTSTAPFTITIDGTNIPNALSDFYQVNEDQLTSDTYKFPITILNNDSDNNPYVDQSLVIDHVFDGQTIFTNFKYPEYSYTPGGPELTLNTPNGSQTIQLTHVTTPTVDPNAIAEYTASFGNPGDPNYTTYTFDITSEGYVEVTRQGVDILRSGYSLNFEASYNIFGANNQNEDAASYPAYISVEIDGVTKPPVPEPNSYEFTTGVVGFIDGYPNENGYFEHNLNGINLITDPASGTGQVDYDPQNESISVYQISNATLTVGGQNVALTASTLFSNDPNVVGEYDFTYQGVSATIVEYKNGGIEIFSQDNGVFPYVDVGQQVVFKGSYSLINQDGIISTTTAPFTITLDGINVPIAYADGYEVKQAQLALGNTYKITPTILDNDDDGNPYIDQPLVLKTVFDGQTIFTDPVYSGAYYTPDGPTLVLQTTNQPDQTIQLTHVTTPTVDPNAIAEYKATFGNPGDLNYTTLTFDITQNGQVEVTKQGLFMLSADQYLVFHALYDIAIANNPAAVSSPADIYVTIDTGLFTPMAEPNTYTISANTITLTGNSMSTNFNNINIITDNDTVYGTDSDPLNENLIVNEITNFKVTLPDGTVKTVSGTLDPGDPIVISGLGTFKVNMNGTISFTPDNPNEFGTIANGQTLKITFNYTNENTDNVESSSVPVSITITGTNYAPVIEEARYGNSPQLTSGSGSFAQQAYSNYINVDFTDQDGTKLTYATITDTNNQFSDSFALPNFTLSSADPEGYQHITTAGYTNLYIKGLGVSSSSPIEIDIKGLDTHAHYQDVVDALQLIPYSGTVLNNAAAGTRELSVQIFDENGLSSNVDTVPYIVTHSTPINTTDTSSFIGNQYIHIYSNTTGQTIYSNDADNIFQIEGANNTVFMGNGNNQFVGTGGHSTVFAGSGNDTIYASGGGNEIQAGSGNDYIDTGTGADNIYVGTGQATIAFQTVDITTNSVDTIYNFITAQGGHANPTVIDLSQILQSTSYTPGVSNIGNFVEIKEASNGTEASLLVDTTGQANFTKVLAVLNTVSHGDIINVFDGNLHQMVATE